MAKVYVKMNHVKQLQMIHLFLLTGQLIVPAVFFVMQQNNPQPVDEEMSRIFLMVMGVYIPVMLVASTFLFRRQLKQVQDKNKEEEKVMQYRQAILMRMAFAEGCSLFCSVVFFVTHNMIFLAGVAAIVLYFLWLRPTADRFQEDTGLSPY